MSDLIRDATIGQIIRWATKGKLLKYPEEEANWEMPATYTMNGADHHEKQMEALRAINERERRKLSKATSPESESGPEKVEEIEDPIDDSASDNATDLEKIATQLEDGPHHEGIRGTSTTKSSAISRVGTRTALSQSHTRAELEEAFRQSTLDQGPSAVIIPTRLDDGTILVDWYTTDDPANPQNWSFRKKMFVTFQIW